LSSQNKQIVNPITKKASGLKSCRVSITGKRYKYSKIPDLFVVIFRIKRQKKVRESE
jgi:hypothetical protein